MRGGLTCAEIVCRTAAAVDAIRAMAEDPDFVVGAGTVTTPAQADEAMRAGARFVVSPGLSGSVARTCAAADVTYVPGATTATEIMAAGDLGLTTLKFFPAETSGGLATISALAGPFADVRFVPTGGLRPANLAAYLAAPAVAAVGGTWLTPSIALETGDFDTVEQLVVEALAIAEPHE